MYKRVRGLMRIAAPVVLFLGIVTQCAAAQLSDPYEILAEHYRALGGLDLLMAERTLYFEADITVSGLTGTIRHWEERPDRSRTEVDLLVISQTNGDNGEVAWELGPNGKLRFEQDPHALARREVDSRLAAFEHLDPDSDVFTVTFEGIKKARDEDCYLIRIASAPDGTTRDWYISVSDLLMRVSIDSRTDIEHHVFYEDYRRVGGVLHSFRQEMEEQPVGQEQTVVVTLLETNMDIDPSLFDPPDADVRDFVFTGGGRSAEIPIEFIEKHIFLPVTIDCSQSLWVLDSGASMSVIDRAYAASLGLGISGTIKGEGAGNVVEVAFATVPSLSVDGVAFSEQQMGVIDIAPLFRRTSDLEIAGILGYDFLSRFVSRIDYANETLTVYDSSTFEYKGNGTILDAPLSDNLFSVQATVDGVYSGRWMLDLGAGGMAFNGPYAHEHGLVEREGVRGIGFGAGGRIPHFFSRFESIEFGGYTVERPVISISGVDAEMTGAFSATERIGNLGNTLFRHFVLYLDYNNQRVIVEKGDDFGEDFPWDRSGLQLWRPEAADIEVLYASPDTPAADAGFEVGDIVLAVNGVGVEHLDGLIALRAMLREEPGTEYRFRVRRGELEKELKLVLRELI